MGSEHLKLVGGSDKLSAGQVGDLFRDALCEALEGVESRADGGTSLGQLSQVRQDELDPFQVPVELGNISAEFLAQGQGGGILQMSSANLDNLVKGLSLHLQGISQPGQGGDEPLLEIEDGGDVHDGGERVVGAGRHVDVVVGVDWFLASHFPSKNFDCSVGDDFVGIHIGLCSRTGLPNDQGEVIDQFEGCHLSSSLLNGLTNLGI